MTRAKDHDKPAIGYHDALRMKVAPAWTVANAPTSGFLELIEIAALTACKRPDLCSIALRGLDYAHATDRWYAMLVLDEYRAILPRFQEDVIAS